MIKSIKVNFDILREQLNKNEFEYFLKKFTVSSKKYDIYWNLKDKNEYIFLYKISNKEIAPYMYSGELKRFKAYIRKENEIVIEKVI
ncbi:hypothetical protein ACWV26_06205 [Rummeliibacillus sp. JY-2-4R]